MSKYQLQCHSLGEWRAYQDNKIYDMSHPLTHGRSTINGDRDIILQLMVDRYKYALTPLRVVEIPDPDVMVVAQIGNL